jgi:hypothetical protein
MRIFNRLSNKVQQIIDNQPMPTQNNKFEKYAYLDLRFDQPMDFNLLGQPVASFASVRPVVDQIKRTGFNGIIINTNVPIDPETGELKLYDDRPGAYNPDKNIPKDTWKIINYAKRNKLDVTLNFNIVDYKTDDIITKNNIGQNFSADKFFESIGNYESKLAGIASKYKVNQIGIGHLQYGFDTEEYKDEWQNVIQKIKTKYKGELSFVSSKDNVVFDMVDVIRVIKNDSNNASLIQELSTKYSKPVNLDPIFAPASESGFDPWQYVNSGKDLSGVNIRYDIQADTIRNILKFAIAEQPASLSGIAFHEFAPWKQADWIVEPMNETGKQWNSLTKLGPELYKNESANIVLKNWLNYSTDDVIGNNRNNKLETFAGNKIVDGKGGRDTLVINNKIANCKIVPDSINGGFDVYNGTNGSEGIYDMYNVEYVKFNDATVSLIGNYDLSKFGWF